ncbi:hypothetical protein EVJ58_g2792 [Rhodofomes roseus]|uniref:CCHC-type domain-containing protein n=1 Tax=Rhodofomes roseus TaxID=34475 RepID=A0A4Y9YSW5_9APHY|nr:hypothetical protein EVJ58_g2792 [Rhodofomes roseus]
MDDGGHEEALNPRTPPPFVVDIKPSYGSPYYELHFYDLCGAGALGMEHIQEQDESNVRRCFNCGSPDHALSSCSERRNHALISLSRQLFNFYKDESLASSRRIHEVEGWRRQRLAWLEEFEPGQIRGELLRDALGLRNGDPGEHVEWLPNIACWGYPKGWVGEGDPRLQVWKIITDEGEQDDGVNDDSSSFVIAGEDEERLQLPSKAYVVLPPSEDDNVPTSDADESPQLQTEPHRDVGYRELRRWASYPGTYFLSSRLFVYSSQCLPEPGRGASSGAVSSTFDAERQVLWDRIVSQTYGTRQLTLAPPSFLPLGLPPPPPSLSPPPLPPSSPPPLLPLPKAARTSSSRADDELEEGEILDMDLSDTD